jgi:hypothetical protein
MEASGRRVDVGRVLSEAFETYRRFWRPLLVGAVVVLGIAGVISEILEASGGLVLTIVGLIIYFAAGVLFTGYVVKLVGDTRDGKMHHTVEELYESAVPYVGILILNGVLEFIGVAIGFALLIVPGLILITIWAVVAPAIVIEDAGPIEAFGRSRELVRGHGWPVFGSIVLAYLAVLIISFVSAGIGNAIADDAGHIVLGTIGDILAAPILAIVASTLFFDLGGGRAAAPAEPAAA